MEREYSLDELLSDGLKAVEETGEVAPFAIWVQGLINYIEYLEALVIYDPDEEETVTLQ